MLELYSDNVQSSAVSDWIKIFDRKICSPCHVNFIHAHRQFVCLNGFCCAFYLCLTRRWLQVMKWNLRLSWVKSIVGNVVSKPSTAGIGQSMTFHMSRGLKTWWWWRGKLSRRALLGFKLTDVINDCRNVVLTERIAARFRCEARVGLLFDAVSEFLLKLSQRTYVRSSP